MDSSAVPAHRLGYLGDPNYDHLKNFLILMEARDVTVSIFADSIAEAASQKSKSGEAGPIATATKRFWRVVDQFTGTRDRGYLDRLLAGIDAAAVTTIIAYWGTRPLGDIMAIKKRRPSLRILLNVLCHPTGLSGPKVWMQNRHFQMTVRFCDGLIVSSQVMQSYLQRHVARDQPVQYYVWPPYLSRFFFPSDRLAASEQAVQALFMGRVDWRRAQPTDNALPFLEPLMEQGIDVYFHRASESASGNPRAHIFDYKPLKEIVRFATQFDVSLIMYNLDSCGSVDRFAVTIPDRLIASVAAGIPIAIPRTGYEACKEYLREYRALIEFDSMEELAARLKDRSAMDLLKANARQDSLRYIGEERPIPFLDQ